MYEPYPPPPPPPALPMRVSHVYCFITIKTPVDHVCLMKGNLANHFTGCKN